ncbi:MAG: type III secretion system chaperone [Acetobacteraceae bacterium]
MPDHEAVQRIIGEFGQTTGIDDLSLDDGGYCCLVIDQDLVINVEFDEAGQRLLLYSAVGRPDADRLPLLMEANYLGQGTDGGTLGLQPGTGLLVLSREVPVVQLDVPVFHAALERFVNAAETWTGRLREAAAPVVLDIPPQGGIRA